MKSKRILWHQKKQSLDNNPTRSPAIEEKNPDDLAGEGMSKLRKLRRITVELKVEVVAGVSGLEK